MPLLTLSSQQAFVLYQELINQWQKRPLLTLSSQKASSVHLRMLPQTWRQSGVSAESRVSQGVTQTWRQSGRDSAPNQASRRMPSQAFTGASAIHQRGRHAKR